MTFRFFLFNFFYILLITKVFAQTSTYKFSRLGIDKGLSNGQINCIYKDKQGYMWFGTMTGLNRYDGYTFKTFRHDIRDVNSLQDNFITKIYEGPDNTMWVMGWSNINIYNPATEKFIIDKASWLSKFHLPPTGIIKSLKDRNGNFWFVHQTKGLYFYNNRLKQTKLFSKSNLNKQSSLYSNAINDIVESKAGDLWIIYKDGFLEKISPHPQTVTYQNGYFTHHQSVQRLNLQLFTDADNDVWIYSSETPSGIFFFNPKEEKFTHLNRQSIEGTLNNDLVRSIAQDSEGKIWVATDHGGINLIDKNKSGFSISYLLHNPDDDKSLNQNSIYSVYADNTGNMWVGTYKAGINHYHANSNKFNVYRNQVSNPRSLPFNDINRFVEDAKGNLWIGTNGGGLIYYNRKLNTYKQFVHDPADKNSLSNNIIVSLYLGKDQKLWIGTYFGGLDYFDGQRFINYRHNPEDPNSLSDDRIWDIFEDSKNNLWVGTLGGGIDRLDRKNNIFKHYKAGQPNSLHSNYISYITEDKAGNLWIATAYGVEKLNLTSGKFTHFINNTNNPKGLSNNNITAILQDSRGLIWIGTNEGLNLLDPVKNNIQSFRKENGLPDNSIQGMIEDQNHTIWLTTQNGLSNLIVQPGKKQPYTFHFKNYDVSDGLQGRSFNNNAIIKTRQGEILIGGNTGFNIFKPSDLIINKLSPKILLTELGVLNKPVQPGDTVHNRLILSESLSQTKEITLKHHENMFSVAFAALNFIQPEKNQYAYQLKGFSDQWIPVDNNVRKVTFTNIDPGTYYLIVKASNNDGVWNQNGTTLKINILPPFWKTNIAKLFYAIFILIALVVARRIVLKQERYKYQLAQEKLEAQRRHDLDILKIKFFTNVSHEFRTPLTLILSPIEKILKENPDSSYNAQLQIIQRNARRLLNLVNQLLDFRKMEVQEIALHTTTADIVSFIKEIIISFSDLSENKNIQFNFLTQIDQLVINFDQDKVEKIINNLLSNAFKFTPEGGRISVEIKVSENASDIAEYNKLVIQVKDNGIGIPLENQDKIFKRFFQSEIPGSMVNQGSGIGLAITKKFVKLHGGHISVKSNPGQGSCFTVTMPIHTKVSLPVNSPAVTQIISNNNELINKPANQNTKSGKKPVVLLIEDNEDFRFYLKDNLSIYYQIKEANNGLEGWQQVVSLLPDLVVSDITMPGKDGISLTRKIKKDPRTAHIPVILLTANSTEDQKLAGYETGANAYITKPFNFEILLSQIKNLISQQATFKEALELKKEVKPQDITITPLDEKLIQKAIFITEANMANPDFSVEELSKELGMSRVYLYKKLLSITGKAPLEFIRTIRLKRAAQLLKESQLTVAEVAYEVGFNNPKYFTKYFKQEFKELPSVYALESKAKSISN